MPRATLTVTIPEEVWIGDLTRRYPDARFQVLAALPGDQQRGVGLAKISAPSLSAVLSDLDDYEAVTEVAVLEHQGENVLIQLETSHPVLLEPAQRSGIPLEMPFTVQAGEVVWEITASRDRLSALNDELTALGIPFTVDSIYRELDSSHLLSDQQSKVLDVAVQEGYYDTPRTCTQEDIAEILELAKSTCSETLHRAEERIVKQFIADQQADLEPSPDSQPVIA